MTIWFTADRHFGHANIIDYCNRPFKHVDEMDEVMIARHNEKVKPEDTVYDLGDFCFGDLRAAYLYARRLNGELHFLPGSHDRWIEELRKGIGLDLDARISPWLGPKGERRFLKPPLYSLEVPSRTGGTRYPLVVVLCHYAMRTWDRSHYGSLHLFGHSHGYLGRAPIKRSMDIGVDCWDFYPVDLETVKERLQKVPAPASKTYRQTRNGG